MKNVFLRFLKIIKQRALSYTFGLIVFSIMGTYRQVILAVVLKDLFDAAAQLDFSFLMTAVLRSLGILLLLSIFQPLFQYIMNRAVILSVGDFRKDLYGKINALEYRHFQKEHSGNLLSRMTNDIREIEEAFSNNLSYIFFFILCSIMVVGYMFYLDVWLAIVALVTGLVAFLFNFLFASSLRRIGRQVQERLGHLTEILADLLAGITVIKTFNLYRKMLGGFLRQNQLVYQTAAKRAEKNAQLSALNDFSKMLDLLGVLGVGAFFALQGRVTVGTVIAIWQLKTPVLQILNEMGTLFTNVQTGLAGAERLFQVMDAPEEPDVYTTYCPQITNPKEQFDSEYFIRVHDVDFAYDDQELVLNKLSFAVKKGDRVALVGPSGQGKSTIFRVLLGFYPPKKGEIYIGDRPLRELELDGLRQQIAYVPQKGHLFSGSIRDNILYGNPDASEVEIIQAAKAANAHDFITEFEKGYDTYVGERGTQLSGGQRQRILIARAILKDAPILLLDEATSSLDSESEQLVTEALEHLTKNRTTLVIAHRLSTIQDADQILVIEEGRVREAGTHDELVKIDQGLYRKLYEQQYQGLKVS